MAFRRHKCSCGPCENMAFTTKHLLRSLLKFLFSGLCYRGSLNNNLFMRMHKDLLVFTIWPDTKRKKIKRQAVSALVFQSAAALEQLTAAIFLAPRFDPWVFRMEWKGVQVALFEHVWQIQEAFLFFHSLPWVRKGKPCLGLQKCSWSTNAAEWRIPPTSQKREI